MTWWNEPTALVLIFGAFCAGCGGFIAIICSNLRMSRCKYFKCCCIEVYRENLTPEEYAQEMKIQNSIISELEQKVKNIKDPEIPVPKTREPDGSGADD